MPRRSEPFLPNQYYHFYNRGNNRQVIFFDRDNYLYFLKGMKKYVWEHAEILAYCLMPTHYHILVRVKPKHHDPESSEHDGTGEFSKVVSLSMQKLGISYTKAINKRFNRVGALFQGQFKGNRVEHYNHLLNLVIYIHANPVKDGLVPQPENWEYSHYLEWMNLRQGTLANRAFIQENFASLDEYKKLVLDYIRQRNVPEEMREYIHKLEAWTSP